MPPELATPRPGATVPVASWRHAGGRVHQTRCVHVSQIWQYPVKSMIGSTVDSAAIDPIGMVGDRTWAVRDLEIGGIRGAKRLGKLMTLAARYEAEPGGPVRIDLPDGTSVSSNDADVDARLSDAVGRKLSLEALRPAEDLDHFRRGPAYLDDMMDELRDMFGRTEDEPLPDFGLFPPEIIEFESPPGTYYDAFPLMIMSTSAMRSMAEALPDSNIDVLRFRPSLVLDTGDLGGHPELDWVGRRITVGEVELELVGPCPRCVMVTRTVTDDLPQDRGILRHIVADLDQNVGVYATVVRPGRITAGDPVVVDGG